MDKFIIEPSLNEPVRTFSFHFSHLFVADKKSNRFYGFKINIPFVENEVLVFLKSIKLLNPSIRDLQFYVFVHPSQQLPFSFFYFFEKFKIDLIKLTSSFNTNSLVFFFEKLEIQLHQNYPRKFTLLIIDDSPSFSKILHKIFSEHPLIEIVGDASDVQSGIEAINRLKPDFVSLDLILPSGTGVDILNSVPSGSSSFFLISDCTVEQGGPVLKCLALGALTYFKKPTKDELPIFASKISDFIHEVSNNFSTKEPITLNAISNQPIQLSKKSLIAIGSSTGGTEVVRDLILGFPKDAPPIVIVQHMPPEFTRLFAERLSIQSDRETIEVNEEVELISGKAYLASGGRHLKIRKVGSKLFALPHDGELVNNFRPSVSVLFESILNLNLGTKLVALMLSGMGRDGANEMALLRKQGAICIGQSEKSCTVYGMPRAAKEAGALDFELSPVEIIKKLGG